MTALTLLVLSGCGGAGGPAPSTTAPLPASAPSKPPTPDPFEAWLKTDFPAAEGFDPLPDGGTTTVQAVARGRVAFAGDCGPPWRHVVMIDHVFYENHERRLIRSVHKGLATTRVRADDVVKRGDPIGTAERADVRFELRWDILVSTSLRRMRVWLQGERIGDYEVAFGQGEGRKRRQHDLRTPLGMYFVVGKSRGPFDGPYGAYYGGHWIKVNYPNPYDAAWGRTQGLLTRDDAARIGEAWRKRLPTWQGSPLGGGIGFHGWADDWDLDGHRRLSWGCVVLRNADIAGLFPRIPIGAMVVIL